MMPLDIRAVWLASFGEDVAVARRSGVQQHRVRCPFHTESRASCDVSLEKHVFYCRSCGASGGALDVVVLAGYAPTRAAAVTWLRQHGVAV